MCLCVCCHVLILVFVICSCVKGNMPQVGDRVVVEASYNPSMPFKWNASRVQVLAGGQVRLLFNANVLTVS
jgi:hypothetical protein